MAVTSSTEWCWASRTPQNILPPKHQHWQVVPRIAGNHLEHIHCQNSTTGLCWSGKITSAAGQHPQHQRFSLHPSQRQTCHTPPGHKHNSQFYLDKAVVHLQGNLVVIATGCMERPLLGGLMPFDLRIKRENQERGVAKAPAHSLPWVQRGDANLDMQFPQPGHFRWAENQTQHPRGAPHIPSTPGFPAAPVLKYCFCGKRKLFLCLLFVLPTESPSPGL